MNLLSNAVKFTEEGQVVLRVERVEDLGGVVMVRFEVTDTGIGIDEGQQENLFQPFIQADASTTRRYGGTGLGLSISRQLVELMGGDLRVRSESGVGSAFSFTLPFTKQPERTQTAQSATPTLSPSVAPPGVERQGITETEPGQVNARILVAEDTLTNQIVAKELLKRRGYEVDVVANGSKAVEASSLTSYAAILMDIQMPVMDGYEATAEIRRREGTQQHTPIIAMTAHALQGDREKALSAGMDDYLSKPVRPEHLDKVLERWVAHAPQRQRVSHLVTTNGPPKSGDSLDPTVLADLRTIQQEGGGEIVEGLVKTFLSETPAHLEVLRAAAEGGEAQEFKRKAHALNGICRGVGARGMAEICLELEQLAELDDSNRAQSIFARLEEEFDQVKVLLDAELSRD
jgi:CheY-like chemotaxis protein